MANYIGSIKEVDHYIGENLVVAKYIGETKYFDAYSDITDEMPLIFQSRIEHNLKNYRIYGTGNGAGVETSGTEPAGYKLPLTITSGEQSQDIPIYIGNSKLGEGEYVDFEEQKVYMKKPNLVSNVLSGVSVSSDGTLTRNAALNGAVTPIEQGKTYTIQYARNSGNMICGFYENYPEVNDTTYDGSRFIWNEIYHTFSAPIDGYLVSSCTPGVMDPVVYEGEYPQLIPTDPPIGFPEILAYQGENTLSSTETLGEAIIKGRIRELTYRRVEYLKSTGTQYIQTDMVPLYSYKSELRIKFGSEIHQIENNDYTYIFGISGAAALGVYCVQLYGSSGNIIRFRDGYYSTDTSITGINPVVEDTLIMNRPTSFYGNASLTTNAAIEGIDPPVEPIVIFGLTGVSAGTKRIWPFKLRDMFLYGFKIHDSNDLLLHNLIPVEREDGELGLLDTITNQFYANAGTGTFEKGAYIEGDINDT